MSFWGELRRRSVFRAGAAYAVVTWLLVQIAGVILSAFEFPAWVFQGFLVIVGIGFLITVVLAWLYDLTPEGFRRADEVPAESRVALSRGRKFDFAVIALLGVAVGFLVVRDHLSSSMGRLADVEIQSLAVLAFTNRSADPADVYFADGLADELLSILSRVQELKVAPRTSSFYFKGKDVDIATIASTLDVENVLTGSVQRDGDRIRVTVALDGAEAGALLWSQSYDREVDSLLDVQNEIALSVTSAIVPVLSPESLSLIAARPTENPEAYDYYLRGREYLRLPPEESTLASAEGLFDRAIDLDPRFAQAYAGRCDTLLERYEFATAPESFQTAEVACHRALTLDDGAWEVRLALANLYRIGGQFEQAILELQNAITRQPNNADLMLALAQTYAGQRRFDLAEKSFLGAESLQSGDWRIQNELGNLYWDANRYDEAIARYSKVIELTPDSGIGYDNLGNTYLSMGNLVEAEKVFNDSPLPSRWTYENRGLVYYNLGEFQKAIDDHRRALDIAPENYTEWGNLGDAFRFVPGNEKNAQGAYERAIQLAEQALSINPDDLETITRLSTYYAFTGQVDRAESLVRRFIEQQPGSVDVGYFFAARTMMHLGEMDLAYEYLRRTLGSGWPRSSLLNDPDLVARGGDERFDRL